MSFLLDTDVVSEWVRPSPNHGVVSWLAEADEDLSYLSVATLAELRDGIERLPASERRRELEQWLRNELPLRFEGRIIPIDATVADHWGKVVARRQAVGFPIGTMDAFIVATALTHRMTIVTRNTADFIPSLKDVFNPWT